MRNATFLENDIFLGRDSGRRIELGEAQESQIDFDQLDEVERMSNAVGVETQPMFEHQVHEPQSIKVQQQALSTQTLCRSSRMHQIPDRYTFLIEDDEPTSHKEAMCDIDSKRWLEAIKSEMDFMYSNQV